MRKKSLTLSLERKKEKNGRKKRKKYVKNALKKLDTFIGKEKRRREGVKSVKST